MDGLNCLNGVFNGFEDILFKLIVSIRILLIRNTQQQIDGSLRAEVPGDSKHLPKADICIDFGHPKF